jgi:hypothetical protein
MLNNKIIKMVSMLVCVLMVSVYAGTFRDASLSGATMLDDEFAVTTHPSLIQTAPNKLSLIVNATPAAGFLYNHNEMLGVSMSYTTPTTDTWSIPNVYFGQTAVATASPDIAAGSVTANLVTHVGLIAWGAKMNSLLLGIGLQGAFVDTAQSSTTLEESGEEGAYTRYNGLRADIKPSIGLDVDRFAIVATADLLLNFFQFQRKTTAGVTNIVTVKPDVFEKIALQIDVTTEIDKKVSAGIILNAALDSTGVTTKSEIDGTVSNDITNANGADMTDLNNTAFSFGVRPGVIITPNDKVDIYFDIPFSMTFSNNGIQPKDENPWTTLDAVTTINWPVPVFGAEVKLLKGLLFRMSAAPAWQRTIVRPVALKGETGEGTQTKTHVDSYSITPALGLSIIIGKLVFEGTVNATFMNNYFKNPVLYTGQSIAGTGSTALYAGLEVKYLFDSK